MYLADTLSRAYLRNNDQTGTLEEEAIHQARFLPVIKDRLHELRQETQEDKTLVELIKVILSGWPEISACVSAPLQPYFSIRDELTFQDGIVFKGERILIPETMRMDMLHRIHSSHIGVEGRLRRARENLFWLGMTKDVKDFVTKCDTCRSFDDKQMKETLVIHDVPTRPWAKVASDLVSHNSKEYLVTVDYFSNFWEVDYLRNTKSKTVIQKLKALFPRYGIPDTLVSDNGPQFASTEFQQFAKEWEFSHVTSSPKYPQSNGKAEQAVKMAERLLKRALKSLSDPYLSLLDFRNTPTQGMDTSPAQRLMSRSTKTLLPTKETLLVPEVYLLKSQKQLTSLDRRQAWYYNRGARDLRPLDIGEKVHIAPPETLGHTDNEWRKGTVKHSLGNRLYEIESNGQTYRRNRRDLRPSQLADTDAHMYEDIDDRPVQEQPGRINWTNFCESNLKTYQCTQE
ncbi:uncharacterized protein K02A2.6-like [Saccostrea cucullata]|uniref:uncharacterized protein K02A2.6-like n=1 Tax=Saccostrea cuccullata TaxID=36930 RepID=UPI002ED6663B